MPHTVNPINTDDIGGPPAEILRTISGDEQKPDSSLGSPTSGTSADVSQDDSDSTNKDGMDKTGTKSSGTKDFEVVWTYAFTQSSTPGNPSSGGSGSGNGNGGGNGQSNRLYDSNLLDGSPCPLAGDSPVATITKVGKYALSGDTVVILQNDAADGASIVFVNEIQKGARGPKAICFLPSGNGTSMKATININGGDVYVAEVGNQSNVSITVAANRAIGAVTGNLDGTDTHLAVKGDGMFHCGAISVRGTQTTSDCPVK